MGVLLFSLERGPCRDCDRSDCWCGHLYSFPDLLAQVVRACSFSTREAMENRSSFPFVYLVYLSKARTIEHSETLQSPAPSNGAPILSGQGEEILRWLPGPLLPLPLSSTRSQCKLHSPPHRSIKWQPIPFPQAPPLQSIFPRPTRHHILLNLTPLPTRFLNRHLTLPLAPLNSLERTGKGRMKRWDRATEM